MISLHGQVLVHPDGINMASKQIILLADPTEDHHADNRRSRDAAIASAVAALGAGPAYTPANPGYWAGTPPATLAAAIDLLAALASNNGANPIG